MKITMLVIVMLLVSYPVLAQQKNTKQKFSFGSQNYAGILEGESGTSLQLQTINGVKYKTWFAGLGVGLDYYYDRSVPLFFSVSKFLSSKKIPLYFNGDIGVSIAWARDGYYFLENNVSYSPGLYWNGGFGYKFASKQGHGFLLNLGYSYKHMIQKTTYTNPCLIGPCPTEEDRYDYRLRRLSVKFGYLF
jgi:hypothetical protein